MPRDLLLEIGVEELPSAFVESAVAALPGLLADRLVELRLVHGEIHSGGTPRRLAVWAANVAERQPDLDEQVLGPPVRVAFDAKGLPTKAATSFAAKLGCPVEALSRIETPKGEYLAAQRKEAGAAATMLLPAALARLCGEIEFKKSMRWADGDVAFGRPVRWIVALYDAERLDFSFAGVRSGRASAGHRFLAPEPVEIATPSDYVDTLRKRHVLVDVKERAQVMMARLRRAAAEAGGQLIEDEFLVRENGSPVEEPHVVAGSFDAAFLALPERVILDVARGHQRYFGVRAASGALLPRYLAVVKTAEKPDNVRRGNDRVMRARLADAKFFHDEDLKTPLGERRARLDGIVFHKRLGSVGDKVRRLERLVSALGERLALSAEAREAARLGTPLAECDLVTLMVGEFPELQGEMGRAYALAQGVAPEVADVIAEHYQPRGADDDTAPTDAGALVALTDRLDTLAGCFAVGLMPTGTADPLALRRAAIGCLRTLLDRRWDLSLAEATRLAYAGVSSLKLDLSEAETVEKVTTFLRERLRGLLQAPDDVVDACLAASFDAPHDAALRAQALAAMPPEVRAAAGEVFKRAANIAKYAPQGAVRPPAEVTAVVHPS